MSYETMQTGLRNVITKIAGYSNNNVTLGDYRVLQRGGDKVVVLSPGPFTRERLDFAGGHQTNWDVIVELFIKYKDDTQVHDSIRDERQNIIDKIDQYPFLDATSGCFHGMIVSGDKPAPVFGEDGSGPHYFMQEMIAKITEQTTVTEAE